MNNFVCSFPGEKSIRDLAQRLKNMEQLKDKITDDRAALAVAAAFTGIYRKQNNVADEVPSLEWITEELSKKQDLLKDLSTALPKTTLEIYNERKPFVSIKSTGEIRLNLGNRPYKGIIDSVLNWIKGTDWVLHYALGDNGRPLHDSKAIYQKLAAEGYTIDFIKTFLLTKEDIVAFFSFYAQQKQITDALEEDLEKKKSDENEYLAIKKALQKTRTWHKQVYGDYNIAKRNESINKIEAFIRMCNNRFSVNDEEHKYYIKRGSTKEQVTESVTEYIERIFAIPEYTGPKQAEFIGNDYDAVWRDHFAGLDVTKRNYNNFTQAQVGVILQHIKKFEEWLTQEYGPHYKVITNKFPMVVQHLENGQVKTIGGQIDMIVVDSNGGIHLFDMKAKRHESPNQYDERMYHSQQNLYNAVLGTHDIQIEDMHLIWGHTDYPIDCESIVDGVVYIKRDGKTIPLKESQEFKVPTLIRKDSKLNIISIPKKSKIGNVSREDPNKILTIPSFEQIFPKVERQSSGTQGTQGTSNTQSNQNAGKRSGVLFTSPGEEYKDDPSWKVHRLKPGSRWTRDGASVTPKTLHVFTDNTDRDSGSSEIPADSAYAQRYGQNRTLHYPQRTQAVIRGLPNARPISTQRWYVRPLIDGKPFTHAASKTTFVPSTSTSYPERTVNNINLSDVTLAIFEDPTTGGEKLTRDEASKVNKYSSYQIVDYNTDPLEIAKNILEQWKQKGIKIENVKVNIAGNGIYNLHASQEQVNEFVYKILKALQDLGVTFQEIRSGGQSGIDQAGIIAAQKLGVASVVHFPKDFKYRIKKGSDIVNKPSLFVQRFMQWHDMDFEEFKRVIDEEFEWLQKTWESGEFDNILFGGQDVLFNGPISEITISRTPVLYTYLYNKMAAFLQQFGQKPEDLGITHPNVAQRRADNIAAATNKEDDNIIVDQPELRGRIQAGSDVLHGLRTDFNPQQVNARKNNTVRFFISAIEQLALEKRKELDKAIKNATDDFQIRWLKRQRWNLTTNNPKWMSEVLKHYTIEDVKERIAEMWRKKIATSKDNYVIDQATKALKHINVLLMLSEKEIARHTGLRLSITISREEKLQSSPTAEEPEDTDPIGNEAEEEEDIKASGTESFTTKAKEQNPHTTINLEVRKIISSVLLFRGQNKIEFARDDIGELVYLPEATVFNVLQNRMSQLSSSDDFAVYTIKVNPRTGEQQREYSFPALESMIQSHPWVRSIINELKRKPDLISKFYNSFRNEVTTYTIVILTDNGHVMKMINRESVEEVIISQALQNINNDLDITHTDLNTGSNTRKTNAIYHAGSLYKEGIAYQKNRLEAVGSVFSSTIRQFINNPNVDISDWEQFRQDKDVIQAIAIMEDALRACGINMEEGIIDKLILADKRSQDYYYSIQQENPFTPRIISLYTGLMGLMQKASEFANQSAVDTNADRSMTDLFQGFYKNFASILGPHIMFSLPATVRQSKKDLPNFSKPCFVDDVVKIFKADTEQEVVERLTRVYSMKDPWYYDRVNKKWRTPYIEDLVNDAESRKQFKVMWVREIEGIEYKDWKPDNINLSFVTHYFYDYEQKGNGKRYVNISLPVLSDSENNGMMKVREFSKNEIVEGFIDICIQELDRIKLVQQREEKRNNGEDVPEIQHFDKRGKKFLFIPSLNQKDIFDTIMALYKEGNTTALRDYLKIQVVRHLVSEEQKWRESLSQQDIETISKDLKGRKIISEIADLSTKPFSEQSLDNINFYDDALSIFHWNYMFGQANLYQIFLKDLAFYKNQIDVQKRLKQIYASGMKLFTNSRYGSKIERAIYIKDPIRRSRSYMAFKFIINKAYQDGYYGEVGTQLAINKRDDALKGLSEIDISDGQSFRTLPGYRSVIDMLGQWTDEDQAIFDRIRSGQYSEDDLEHAWQTIKPYMFASVFEKDGVDDDNDMVVFHQNKNSEFLLLAAYGIVNEALGSSGMMVALQEFMEDNDIHVAHFTSAVKTGMSTPINCMVSQKKMAEIKTSPFWDTVTQLTQDKQGLDDDDRYILALNRIVDRDLTVTIGDYTGKITQDKYNELLDELEPSYEETKQMLTEQIFELDNAGNVVVDNEGKNVTRLNVIKELPYERYVVQQPTPQHIVDCKTIVGSQFRVLAQADLPDDFKLTIKGVTLNKKEVLLLLQNAIIQNLLESYRDVASEFESIEKLQASLMSQIASNPKYSDDIREALQLVEITTPSGQKRKVFNLPTNNPATTYTIQDLILSKFKNRITKQYIKGGNAILVSSVGYTDKLHFVIGENGNVEGCECYLPLTSKKFFKPFMKTVTKTVTVYENGQRVKRERTYQIVDIEAIRKQAPELLEAIGYRIPTEDKYSAVPLIVKGFLPQLNGSSIMLPMEVIFFSGEDFDVDKDFIFLKAFTEHKTYNWKQARQDFLKAYPNYREEISKNQLEEFGKWFDKQRELIAGTDPDAIEAFNETIDEKFEEWAKENAKRKQKEFINEENRKQFKRDFKRWFKEYGNNYLTEVTISVVDYDMKDDITENLANLPKMSTSQRNNLIIDLMRGILTSKEAAPLVTGHNNFDDVLLSGHLMNTLTQKDAFSLFVEYIRSRDEFKDMNLETLTVDKILKIVKDKYEKNDLKFFKQFEEMRTDRQSPLSVLSWIDMHQQNMAAASLVGGYANNNTGQAKIQECGLEVDSEYVISIDNEHQGTSKKHIHGVLSRINNDSGIRILSQNAQLLAGAVDNGKNQIMDKVFQNHDTLNVGAYFTRAGFSIHQMALYLGQPNIRLLINNNKFRAVREHKKLLKAMEEALQQRLESENPTLTIDAVNADTHFDSDDLLKSVIEFALNIYNEDYTVSLEAEITRYKVMRTFVYRIFPAAKALQEVTQELRADSPNGALTPFVADALAKLYRTRLLLMKATSQTNDGRNYPIRNVVNLFGGNLQSVKHTFTDQQFSDFFNQYCTNPMFAAFHYLGIECGIKLASDYFVQLHPNIINTLFMIMGNMKEMSLEQATQFIRMFMDDLNTYLLSNTDMFGDVEDPNNPDKPKETLLHKKQYYTYTFPNDFANAVQNNEILRDNLFLSKIQRKNGRLIFDKSTRREEEERDRIRHSLDELLESQEIIKVGQREMTVSQFCEHLFNYSYYIEQLHFAPNNYGFLFTTTFLTAFPEYIQALRNATEYIEKNMPVTEFLMEGKFVGQFFLNHMGMIAHPVNDFGNNRAVILELGQDGKKQQYLGVNASQTTLYSGQAFGLTLHDIHYPIVFYDDRFWYKSRINTSGANGTEVLYSPIDKELYKILQTPMAYYNARAKNGQAFKNEFIAFIGKKGLKPTVIPPSRRLGVAVPLQDDLGQASDNNPGVSPEQAPKVNKASQGLNDRDFSFGGLESQSSSVEDGPNLTAAQKQAMANAAASLGSLEGDNTNQNQPTAEEIARGEAIIAIAEETVAGMSQDDLDKLNMASQFADSIESGNTGSPNIPDFSGFVIDLGEAEQEGSNKTGDQC